jgi:hypothetical protein
VKVNATLEPLNTPVYTGEKMVSLVKNYYKDLGHFLKWPLCDFLSFVSRLKYLPDPIGQETISRPRHLLNASFPFRDCDDKSILVASYLYAHFIPFRFIAISTKNSGDLHHVLVKTAKNLIDCTYPRYSRQVFKPPYLERITKKKFLTPWVIHE